MAWKKTRRWKRTESPANQVEGGTQRVPNVPERTDDVGTEK